MIIKICGLTAEGKTAIANFIDRQLELAGINATVIDDGDEQYLSTKDLTKKMDALRARDDWDVRIETVQVALPAKRN